MRSLDLHPNKELNSLAQDLYDISSSLDIGNAPAPVIATPQGGQFMGGGNSGGAI